jgi:hypothetical protein
MPPLAAGADGRAATLTPATRALAAVLFSEILKPLTAGLGPVGDVAIESAISSVVVEARS